MAWVKTGLGGLWSSLKFVGRWLGPALLLLAVYLFFSRPMPFSDVSGLPALAGAVVTAIASVFMRAPKRRTHRRMLFVVALAGFAFWGWRNWEADRGYRTEIVSFENKGAKLVGTLYLPDRPGKFPGLVFVHGSGNMPRWTNQTYGTWLARAGYAVLIYDKRGVGDSGGTYVGQRNYCPDNLDLLASDAAAALALLEQRSEVRPGASGFFGASQAGWIIPRAAVKNRNATFMLLLSGPTTPTHEIVKHEEFRLGSLGRDKQSELRQMMILLGSGGPDIPDGTTPDQAYVLAQKTDPDLECGDLDPRVDLRKLDIPGLWLLGEQDWIVPFGVTARNLDILRTDGKAYEYRKILGAGHLLNGQSALVERSAADWLAKVTEPVS